MSWTNFAENEKQRIYDWAVKNYSEYKEKEIFGLDKDENSFFEKSDSTLDIVEYSYETLPELKELIHDMWVNDSSCFDEIIFPCVIAAFKGREFIIIDDYEKDKTPEDVKLPDYVYMF